MTLAAENVMKEIQAMLPEERLQVWQQLSQLVIEAPATNASDREFEGALEEVTGCTAQRNATGRLLQERQGERKREWSQLQARADRSPHA